MALDAAAVEAALSLCEEAVSEGHTLPGPWETQELKASEPTPTIQESAPPQTPQDMVATLAPTPASQETQNQPDTNREEPLKGNYEGPEVTGSDVTSSVTSDDGVAASEVAEEGPVVKEVTEATVKSEGEEWSQPEPNPPCLGAWITHRSIPTVEMLTHLFSHCLLVSVPQTLRTALCPGKSPR